MSEDLKTTLIFAAFLTFYAGVLALFLFLDH